MSARPNFLRGGSFPGSARVTRRIRTRPSLAVRLVRAVRCSFLRWQIASTEQYIAACERDGIVDSLSMRDFRYQLDALRVRLALLEGGL